MSINQFNRVKFFHQLFCSSLFLICVFVSPTLVFSQAFDIPSDVEEFIKKAKLTPLDKAILKYDLPQVNELIKNGAELNPANTEEGFPLIYAVIANSPEIVELLIKKGAKVNTQMKGGVDALYLSVTWNLLDVTRVLIQQKADLKRVLNGSTVLDIAESLKLTEVAGLLRKHGAINAPIPAAGREVAAESPLKNTKKSAKKNQAKKPAGTER